MNLPTKRQDTMLLPGILPNAEVYNVAKSFRVEHDFRRGFQIDRLPTSVERQMLFKRAEELDRVLAPISEERPCEGPRDPRTNQPRPSDDKRMAAMYLGQMFMGWSSTAGGNIAGERVTAFIAHLGDLPLFAIEKACADAAQGRLTKANGDAVDSSFPPSAPDLHRRAKQHAASLLDEQNVVGKVLAAKTLLPKPRSAAERERAASLIGKLAADLKNVQDKTPEQIAAEQAAARRRVEEKLARERENRERQWRAEGYEPMPNSDGTLTSVSFLMAIHQWPPKGATKIGGAR